MAIFSCAAIFSRIVEFRLVINHVLFGGRHFLGNPFVERLFLKSNAQHGIERPDIQAPQQANHEGCEKNSSDGPAIAQRRSKQAQKVVHWVSSVNQSLAADMLDRVRKPG